MFVQHEPSDFGAWRDDASDDMLGDCSDWRPVIEEFTVFFEGVEKCPACRLKRSALRLPTLQRIHVHRRGDAILITEVEDVHAPGWRASGAWYRTSGDGESFHIDAISLASGSNCPLLPGAAVSLLTANRKRTLVLQLTIGETGVVHVIEMRECLFN